ncbi:DUF3427 domain-containing protein [Chitinimonas taiwanensis]|uniref:DUF3427 domain-containing protein n=1 Tax=Chitinimonas taiwanensis TaxID=240412 RepID=UPI0035B27C3A
MIAAIQGFSADSVATFGYADSTDFDLVYDGHRFPPKAVLGVAAQRVVGRPLTADEFAGGEASPCFAILRALGFEIVKKAEPSGAAATASSLERYRTYDRRGIAEVFEPGGAFTPGAGRWGMPGIVESPKGSGHFVFMVTLGKPTEGNPYQDALTEDGFLIWESQSQQDFDSPVIRKLLVHDADARNIHLFLRPQAGAKYTYLGLLEYFSHDANKSKPVHFIWRVRNWDLSAASLKRLELPVRSPLDPAYSLAPEPALVHPLIQVPAPAAVAMPNPVAKKSAARANNGVIDWAERDLRNRQLGLQGEKLVLQYEMDALIAAGRADLAARVRHVALVDAAAGFDIESFRPDGSPKRIEVKTTQGTASTPFYISLNEVLASRNDASSYSIYRVFDYRPDSAQVRFFELLGDVELSCGLEPVSFRAYPGNGVE